MVTILALLGVLGVLVAAAFISTREEPLLADAPQDAADLPLPDEPLTPDDVRRLRFSMAPRGYRMSEVDLALERLQAELADRDRRIALLEARAEGAERTEVREATAADLPVPPAPAVETPAAVVQEPVVQEPVVQEPVVQEPIAHLPGVPEPVAHAPFVQEPAIHEPAIHEPAIHEPAIHEPAIHESAIHESSVQEPLVTEPSAQEPDVHEPVVHEPLISEPVVHEPVPQQQPVGSADPAGIPPLPPVTPADDGAHLPEELPPADLGSALTRPPEDRQQ